MNRREVVERIHGAPPRLVLAVTGGGNAVVTDLLGVAGASRTVLEIVVPYSERSLADLLGGPVDGAVSAATARAMAESCARRAAELVSDDVPTLGVACTAALATDRVRRGEHRAHVAVVGDGILLEERCALDKGVLDREGEDRVVADAVLSVIARACGVG